MRRAAKSPTKPTRSPNAAMVRTNREILTGGKKYKDKAQLKHRVEEVVFDRDLRKEYLTGFHKRKLERKKNAQNFIKEQERLERIRERKEIREERKKDLETQLLQFNDTMKRINDINDSDDDDNNEEWGGFGEDKGEDDDDDEDKDDAETPKGILARKQVYVREDDGPTDAIIEDETVVEVEPMENPVIKQMQEIQQLAKANNVDLKRLEEVLEGSLNKARQVAVISGVAKPKPKLKKKFRYLTKAERRANNRKIKDKKFEKFKK